jgi:cytochrome b subunit of formate dehydrogenase
MIEIHAPKESRREVPEPEEFLRFTLGQRLEHWVLVFTFFVLVATGLPQKFHNAEVSTWIIETLGGIDNARLFHRIFATLFIFESSYHLGAIVASVVQRRFTPSMVPTPRDFRDAFDWLRYSVGLTSQRPQFDRYDYRQIFEYWGIVFGAIIMVATGLILWFPTYATRFLPGEIVAAAKEMHSGEALLAFLIIVMWHFYSVVFSPNVFPLDSTMINGKISRERMIEEHLREYARLMGIKGAPPHPSPQGAAGSLSDQPSGRPRRTSG